MTVEQLVESAEVAEPPRLSNHIVHAVISLDVGGLERIVVDLARTSVARGNRVTVLCLERPGLLAPQATLAGAEVICLDKKPGIQRELTQKARTLLDQLRPNVLHTHQIGALWYLGPAAKELGVASVVHTEHIDNVGKARGWLAKLKLRVLWNRAAQFTGRFCCVSDDIARTAACYQTVPKKKLRVLLNGIDTQRCRDRSGREILRERLGIAADATVIGSVGRLSEVKRQDLLLEGFAHLAKEFRALRLLLVGDGPERASLEELAMTLGVGEQTIFAGYQANPEQYLAAMDVFALTSRLEGLPLVMLEAWASGLPVVASAVGGIPKVLEHGRTGLLFPSGDGGSLVTSLREVLMDQVLAARLAEAGRAEVCAKYSLERMADDYEEQYAAAKAISGR